MIQGKYYLVIGGPVISQRDGQEHFVSAMKLCNLYGVDPKYCYLTTERDYARDTLGLNIAELVVLRPRADGDYVLPRRKV